jgi:hypothetical protein
MSTPGITYITGYSISSYLDDEHQKSFIRSWAFQHASDHFNIYTALNRLELILGLPAFEINQFQLYFNPENTGQVNDFIFYNNQQHSNMYGWLNSLGAQIPHYTSNKAMAFTSVLNPVSKMVLMDMNSFNQYFLLERNIHSFLNANLNGLYAAYSL